MAAARALPFHGVGPVASWGINPREATGQLGEALEAVVMKMEDCT